MDHEQLKEKALSLPLSPGVYLMRDKADTVIYVGKAKRLKNRVSQYFQGSQNHSVKTRAMVSKIHHFEVIVAATEFEALILESSLIKRHLPKYNILLKDDKGYPFIRLDTKERYPKMELVSKISNDHAEYFGPFGSRGVTNNIIQSLQTVLMLPSCSKKFPRDIGKERPCLHYHMNQCTGWCQQGKSEKEYADRIEQVRQLLGGNYKKVADETRAQMHAAAELLDFERAASLRDRLSALEALGQKQLVTAGSLADTDVVGFGKTEAKACFSVLHYSGGNLLDKDFEILSVPEDDSTAVSALVKQFYIDRGFAPKRILLPCEMEDRELLSEYLSQQYNHKVKIIIPERGDKYHLVALANKNAFEEAARITTKEEKQKGTLRLLGKMLGIDLPRRVESFDVSNISGTDIVASMVVFEDGKPRKSEYKKFKMKDMCNQDDYAAMYQTVLRRFTGYRESQKGFDVLPDLLLIDGGQQHASVALEVLRKLNIDVPVVGMVKDDKHRTRALVTPEGDMVRIDSNQAVFSFVGTIQEETHRFAISYHRQLRSKRLRYSCLDDIPGVGPKRKQELLKHFKSLAAIGAATIAELERFLPNPVAKAVYDYFHGEKVGG